MKWGFCCSHGPARRFNTKRIVHALSEQRSGLGSCEMYRHHGVPQDCPFEGGRRPRQYLWQIHDLTTISSVVRSRLRLRRVQRWAYTKRTNSSSARRDVDGSRASHSLAHACPRPVASCCSSATFSRRRCPPVARRSRQQASAFDPWMPAHVDSLVYDILSPEASRGGHACDLRSLGLGASSEGAGLSDRRRGRQGRRPVPTWSLEPVRGSTSRVESALRRMMCIGARAGL